MPAYLFRWRCGWLLGHRFLLLIHIGRRSRPKRYTVLEIMEYRPEAPELVVMSGFGSKADWFRNINATPGPEVVVGSMRFVAVHRILDVDEGATVIAGYERRNQLFAPIIRTVMSRLLGWSYDSSERAHRRAAAQLPLVAFRPRRNVGSRRLPTLPQEAGCHPHTNIRTPLDGDHTADMSCQL
jgi:deazaflavin-dependent oxidoreductase (nitroreductase family)